MWEMNGYGYYVWPAYGIVFMGLAWLGLNSVRQAILFKRKIKKAIEQAK